MLGRVALHGQHRLADHDIRTRIGQSGLGRVGDLDFGVSGMAGDDAAYQVGGVGVGFRADIGTRASRDDLRCGPAQARRQFEHIGAGNLGAGQQGAGEFDAAGAQHSLAQPGQQPVSLDVLVIPVGQGKRMFFARHQPASPDSGY